MIQSFDNLYDNPFNPHLEVVHFEYPIQEEIEEIEPETVENMQKQEEYKETKQEVSEIKEEEKSVSLAPVYPIKDITPKKSLFRRK